MKGKRIQNYIIDAQIGEGGMGTVHLAHHALMTERKAAIKILNAQLSNNVHIKERFKNEASTLARLNHPQIVALYDYLEEENEAFLIMEYAEGTPLDVYIQQNGKIAEPKAKELLKQIAEGIAYAHSMGIVHRDIKPANFIITPDNKVKILDFGIAKMIAEESRHLTKTGMRMGSVYFMSPEQVRGDKDLTHRTDIYSLGLMYYVMLTGQYPLENLTSEYVIYDTIVNKDFIDVDKMQGVSDTSKKIIQKCLQRNPQDRFATALDISKLLSEPDTAIKLPLNIVSETLKPKIEPSFKTTENLNTPTKESQVKTKSNIFKIFFVLLAIAGGLLFAFWDNIDFDVFKRGNSDQNNLDDSRNSYSKMYVVSEGLNLRDEPSTTGAILLTITYGKKVEVINKKGDWVKVLYNGTEGYVYGAYLSNELKSLYQVQSYKTLFYAEPNVYTPTGSYLVQGNYVSIERRSNGFAYVNFNGTTGWLVESDLIQVK